MILYLIFFNPVYGEDKKNQEPKISDLKVLTSGVCAFAIKEINNKYVKKHNKLREVNTSGKVCSPPGRKIFESMIKSCNHCNRAKYVFKSMKMGCLGAISQSIFLNTSIKTKKEMYKEIAKLKSLICNNIIDDWIKANK